MEIIIKERVPFLGLVHCKAINSCNTDEFVLPNGWDIKKSLVDNVVNWDGVFLFENRDRTFILVEERNGVTTVYYDITWLHSVGNYPCCHYKNKTIVNNSKITC